MRFILFLGFLSFIGCATHEPMSELVMFNKEREARGSEDSTKRSGFALSGTFQNNDPRESYFDAKNEQNYADVSEGLSLGFTLLEKEDFAFNFSVGSSTGMDFTAQLINNSYVTTSISTNGSGQLVYQYRMINGDRFGMNTGLFVSRENRFYDSNSQDFKIGRDGNTDLLGFGLKSRFLFIGNYHRAPGISGSFKLGYLPEVKNLFIGFSFSFLTL